MKNITILIGIICMSSLCFSQEPNNAKPTNKIGITYSSFGTNDLVYFQQLDGAGSYSSDNFFTLGINYLHSINNWLFFETGLEYSEHSVFVNPNLPPDMDQSSYKTDFSIINVPLTMRADFMKYLFLNGGLLIDIDTSKDSQVDSQTGIGGLVGIGANYDFKFGASLFINPYLKFHALIPFSGGNYPQRLIESGIRIGATYKLGAK